MNCIHLRQIGTCGLGKATPAELPGACGSCRWFKGRPTSIGDAVRFVGSTVATAVLPTPDEDEIAYRIARCMDCDARRVDPDEPGEIGWCSECGCGGASRARLSRKVRMRAIDCPRRRWTKPHNEQSA